MALAPVGGARAQAQALAIGLLVAAEGAFHQALVAPLVLVEDAAGAEVEQPEAPVVEKQHVAGMGIGPHETVPIEEPADGLEELAAVAVAQLLGGTAAQELREVRALQELGGQDARRGMLLDHARHHDLVQVGEQLAGLARGPGLGAVVRLALEHLAHVLELLAQADPVRGQAQGQQQQAEVPEVAADRGGDARVLDLDRDLLAALQPRAVDLPQRSGRERARLEAREDALGLVAELVAHHLAQQREVHRRRLEVQGPEHVDELVRHQRGVARERLSELLHAAAQVAHRAQQAHGRLQVRLVHATPVLVRRRQDAAQAHEQVPESDAHLQRADDPAALQAADRHAAQGDVLERGPPRGEVFGKSGQGFGDERVHEASSSEATNMPSERSRSARVSSWCGDESADHQASSPR